MKRTTALILALLLVMILLLSGCEKQEGLYREVLKALDREDPEDLRITVYYMDFWIETRIPMTLDMLTGVDEEDELSSVSVYHLDGPETKASVDVIRDRLQAETIRPTERTGYLDARVYYVLKNKDGDIILDLLIGGRDPACMYFNTAAVEYDAVFHDVIRPCIGYEGDDLWMYFGGVVEQPDYGKNPGDYPDTVWVCEDPKITLTVLSDGDVRCEIEGMSAAQTEGTELYAGFDEYSNRFGITRLDTVRIDHYGEYETPIVDMASFECRCEYSPTQVIATVVKDELFAGRYTDQQIVFVRK